VNPRTTRRIAAATLAGAAMLAIAGFTALGSVFEYPQILEEPIAEILVTYRASDTAISFWFLVLVISAALLAPAGVLLGLLAGGRRGRAIAVVGIAAATVQVVGLSRWVLFVPAVSRDALNPATREQAEDKFEQLHFWLGTIVGETIGYVLTATFTVLVAAALAPALMPRWMAVLAYLSAALIATGVLIPLGVEPATLTNFAGYVLWCLWLIVLAVFLWRPRVPVDERPRTTATRSRP
jgi:hypothetical protein